MQSGGGAACHGRNTAASASASPSSSPSAASAPHLGFDPIQQQNQPQQHQLQQRQSFHQQLLRTPEGNETNIAYQSGGLRGVLGGGNFVSNSGLMQFPQQSRKLVDFGQQHGFLYMGEEVQNRSQGFDQQMLNPVYQAYLQSAYQTAQRKSAMGMQPQQLTEMGMVGPSEKDLDMPLGNLKMQDHISSQAANQAQALLSNKQSEQFIRGESLTEEQQQISDRSSDPKSLITQTSAGQFMPGNIMRPEQAPKSQQSIQNMANSQLVMTKQMQAMQALALEHNIDLSLPANANLMVQLILLMQSRMVSQHKATESNMDGHSSSVPMTKQQFSFGELHVEDKDDFPPNSHKWDLDTELILCWR